MISSPMANSEERERFPRSAETSDQGTTAPNSKITKMLSLVERGNKEIELNDKYKSAIIVLGRSGTGKSTFVQWIAEKDDKLISSETSPDSGDYSVKDTNEVSKISINSLESKTIFPELVIDLKTNIAYYDCPGFGDTRGSDNDIPQAYFIKKLAGHLTRVKLVFVASENSVKTGADRNNFLDLLRHSSALLKNIDKFKKSISLVVTKVEKRYSKGKAVSDEKVIESIARFMKDEAKDTLVKKLADKNENEKEKTFAKRGIKFIDIFLTKEKGKYARIVIFRKPDASGPLNTIKTMKEGKKRAHEVIYKKLKYAKMQNSDFGYSIADGSKLVINDLVTEINNKVWSSIRTIVEKIEDHYRESVDSALAQLKYLDNGPPPVYSKKSAEIGLSARLATAVEVAASLVKNIKDASTISLAEKLQESINRLKMPELQDDLSDISSQGKFSKFLQTVNDKKFAVRPWQDLLKPLESDLTKLNQELKSEMEHVAQNLRDKIKFTLGDVEEEIKKNYRSKIKVAPLKDLSSLYSKGREMMDKEDAVTASSQVTSQRLLKKVKNVTSKLAINSNAIKMGCSDISRLSRSLKYLDAIAGSIKFDDSPEWRSPFKNLEKYFEQSVTWYKFLDDLHSKLTSYDVQRHKTIYKSDSITKSNLKNFLNKISKLEVTESNAVGDLPDDADRLGELNELLESTINTDPRVTCQSDTLTVEGDIIKFGDFIGSNGFKTACREPRQLKIFALSKLFIDQDLIATGKKLLVVAVAPKWEAVGTRKIDLSGADGEPPPAPIPPKTWRVGEKGKDGAAGKPGGSAGSFLGIAGELSESRKGVLSLIASGGKGGSGEAGGDGAPGSNGHAAPTNPAKYQPANCYYKAKRNKIKDDDGIIYDAKFECDNGDFFNSCHVNITSRRGGDGGPGGTGGAGGKGGRGGNVDLLVLDGKFRAKITKNAGPSGSPGAGGKGGVAGRNGDFVFVFCEQSIFHFNQGRAWADTWKFLEARPDNTKFRPGKDGQSGVNHDNVKDSEPPATFASPASIINEYKMYLRENLDYTLKRHTLSRFLQKLDSSQDSLKFYGTLDFIDELKQLEDQRKPIKLDKELLTTHYQSILNRISKYVQNRREAEKSEDYHKVLAFLHSAILSKLHDMRAGTDHTMIIDVEGYLDIVQKDIKTLSDTKERRNKFNVIEEYKLKYKERLDKKIEEADALIADELLPSMDKLNGEIDEKLEQLIEEIKHSIKDQKANKKKLEEQKRQFEQQLAAKAFFDVLDLTGHVTSCLPQTAAAGQAVGGVSSILRPMLLKPISVEQLNMGGTNKLDKVMRDMKEKKVAQLQKRLDRMTEELKAHPKLKDVAQSVKAIKEKLESLKRDGGDIDSNIKGLQTEASDSIAAEEKKQKLNNGTSTDDKLLNTLIKCQKFVSLPGVAFEIIDRHKDDETYIAIRDSLDTVEDNIKELENFKKKVHTQMAPMLENMKKGMEEVESGLKSKSQVGLEVTKWQVQSSLQDIKEAMNQATKGLEVQSELARCIEKLSEVMTTMINIYDRIQNYQEQDNLVTYIGDITSVEADKIDVADQKLARAIRDLEVSIRSNLIVDQYHTALSSVKQWVFPFAHKYVVDFNAMLPSPLKSESGDLSQLAHQAAEHMSQILQKVKKYKVSIDASDEFLNHGLFDGEDVASPPFYIWHNEEYRNTLASLLAGKQVFLNADVTRSSPKHDAMKFKWIGIKFKSSNKTLQSKLNESLKKFKVSATHMGNSYYRYKGKFYVISSSSQNIEYSFSQDKHGKPRHKNAVYQKMKKGDIILSPYAMWKIQLLKLNDTFSFDPLRVYSQVVDLELVGKGTYVSNSAKLPNFNASDYYELYEDQYQPSDTESTVTSNRRRRSVPMSVASSASRPSSWLSAVVSSAIGLIGRLSNVYVNPSAIETWNELVYPQNSEAWTLFDFGEASGRPSSTMLEMGDEFLANTEVSGLLAWGTLLARRWSGYRPKVTATATQDSFNEQWTSIELAIRSHTLVGNFMRSVEQFARSREIRSSGAVNNHKLYTDCVSLARQKLARGEDDSLAVSLVDIVSKVMLHLDSDDLGQLLSIVAERINNSNEKRSQENERGRKILSTTALQLEQPTEISFLGESSLLRHGLSNWNSFDLPLGSSMLPRDVFDKSHVF